MPETGLLQRDERLPHLELIWSPERMTAFLNEPGPGHLFPAPIAGVRLTNLTYRPARVCIALYELTLAGGTQDRAVVTMVKDERLARAHEQTYVWAPGRAVYLREMRCLVERFPHDWELPALSRAAEPASAARLLNDAGFAAETAASLDIDILAYRPHEAAVLEYRQRDGARTIAKVFGTPGRAEQVERVIGRLREQLTDDAVWTPNSRRAPREADVLFSERAQGVSLHEALSLAAAEAQRVAIGLAAKALVTLHNGKMPELPVVRTVRQGYEHTRDRADRLPFAAPSLARRAAALLERLGPRVAEGKNAPVFVHGDFKGTQLLLHEGRVAVIDLDSACRGEAAVDVGNMMADLRRVSCFNPASAPREGDAAFLDAYASLSENAGIAEQARVFQAVALVRMAVHAFRQNAGAYSGEAPHPTELLLDEAEACLQAL